MSGRGSVKKLDIDIVISATTVILNSLSKDKDHPAEGVYLLIAKEYERLEGGRRKHYNEYPIKRFFTLVKTTRLKKLGWKRIKIQVLTDIRHKGKLIKREKNYFRYIGDDE